MTVVCDMAGFTIANRLDGLVADLLVFAAGVGETDAVSRLLSEAGAKVDDVKNETGRTALSAAAASGHAQAVDVLLRAGADVTLHKKGHPSPLMLVCCHLQLRPCVVLCFRH